MHTVLTIASSDCSGGAGIQADLKTMTANGVYGMSAITSITAQNTCGVAGVYDVSPEALKSQLDAVFTDIFPDSVKIGMVSSVPLIKIISEKLKKYNPKNIVLDPVMVSTSGHSLLAPDAQNTLISELFPLADIITPNAPEAEVLSGISILSESDMLSSAKFMAEKFNTAVLLKGGHIDGNDLLYYNENIFWIRGKYINTKNTHGTGCTLSSAIASQLAKGHDMHTAVIKAKHYISGAIQNDIHLGHGHGPLNHIWNIQEREEL